MPRLPIYQQVLLFIQTFALLALAVRLGQARMHRRYVYFFAFLLLALSQTILLAISPFGSPLYRNVYVVTEALITCSYVLVTLELYSIVLRDLTGIARVSREFIRIILVVATLVSLLLLGLESAAPGVTGTLFAIERPIYSSLVFFLLLINAFLVYYPVGLTRNAIVYSIGYAVYFLTKAAILFVINLGLYRNTQFSTVLITVSTACLLFWLFALNERGERKTVAAGHWWTPEDEGMVLARLRAINRHLLRPGRK